MRLALAAVALAGCSCSGGFQMSAGVQVSVQGGGYAAMDEIPVSGGELRLVEPKVVAFEGQQRDMIGFPLKHTGVTAQVGGMMGVYDIQQVFENPFDEPIEAVYVFPLGADGAVSEYRITLGDRSITGEIHKKEDARAIYDKAKAEGHTAGLIEQNKPNIFTQHIANIAPHEAVTIDITYVEMLKYDNGSYELSVPLVVGPRYKPAVNVPYVPDPSLAPSTVSFEADIDAGVPILDVKSPSHDIVVTPQGASRTHVAFGRADELPNRDVIVRYQTAGPQTTVGLLTHRVDDNGYFVLAIQPKAEYRTGDIAPREVQIVIDRSGSMDGAPIAQAKAVASGIIDSLTERDTFDIIAFASGVESMSERPLPGDLAGKAHGIEYLRTLTSGGGTEMRAGVARMLSESPGSDRIRVVYFITDGFIGNDDEVVGAAKQLLGTNRIFTVGIGSAPNRSLLDRLAKTGRGFSSYLTLTEPAAPLAATLVAKSAHAYLTDIAVDWGGLEVEDMTPPGSIPDVYAGQPLVISGRYKQPGAATIRVSATTAGQRVTLPVQVELPAQRDFEPAASLWARRQIDTAIENKDERDPTERVTELGLRFHLVTDYTSFVAVDRSRVVSNGVVRTVEQPALVAEGVNPDTTIGTTTYPSSSRPSRSSDDGCCSSWGSGGGDEPAGDLGVIFLVLATLGGAWVIGRRFV
jgi:Ca-activated chloride channel family protein